MWAISYGSSTIAFLRMFAFRNIQALAHLAAYKISWATRTNKGINHSFVTIVPYEKFHISSTIGAKHARICPILSLLHTLCNPS